MWFLFMEHGVAIPYIVRALQGSRIYMLEKHQLTHYDIKTGDPMPRFRISFEFAKSILSEILQITNATK